MLKRRITNGLAARWRRRFYFLSRLFGARVPVHNLSWLPDGFVMQPLGATGVRLIDNFCSPHEAALLIDSARTLLERAQTGDVVVNDVALSGQFALSEHDGDDSTLLPLLYRCAVAFGIPYTHVERIAVGRVSESSSPDLMGQNAPLLVGRSQHCVLIFLNEMAGDDAGETVFTGMKLAISPRVGRAVCWSVAENFSATNLGLEELLPRTPTAEKWFMQVWLRDRALRADLYGAVDPPQARQGQPLSGKEFAPDGVWAPQDVDLEAVFGQADKMKGLL